MGRARGFTLIEVMVVVVIIAILAAVALPSYNDYLMRGKITEATSNLSDLRVRLEQYYADNRNYGSTATACGIAMPSGGDIKYFTFSCNWGAGGTNQSYTITATGGVAGGDQSMAGFTYTINQSNAKVTTAVPSAAWGTAPINCWVVKKGGQC